MATHDFHIPVMGTGFTIDTPLRVARFGIDSVMSIVDDALCERVRRHYAHERRMPAEKISLQSPDSRARRITAYLDLIALLLERQMEDLRALPFVPGNDKTKYFEMLADDSMLKLRFLDYLEMRWGAARRKIEDDLTRAMTCGSADVNIMTKLDRARYDDLGVMLGSDHHDAKAALRGFAASRIVGNLVLSAGMNPTLLGMLERFSDFYRDAEGRIRKGVILKVSDYRSALVQGKFLAKKGIELLELRIESGLNCGGHAFPTDGTLMGPILAEIVGKRTELEETFAPAIAKHYAENGMPFVGEPRRIRITVQGGIGNYGEARRMREHYGADATGWASPFLLVPEATALDEGTRAKLAAATEKDLYLSNASPLGVPFNNLRGSSSERWTKTHIDEGRPGSACPRGYLASNTEFTDRPICTASREYQRAKLDSLGLDAAPHSDTTDPSVRAIYDKTCICNHLGNGALIALGQARPDAPVAVCPGPNIAWFNRQYTLREMVDHIHGCGESLVAANRPHVFAKELEMYVDYFEKMQRAARDNKASARVALFKANLETSMAHYRTLLSAPAYDGENLRSLAKAIGAATARLATSQSGLYPPIDRSSGARTKLMGVTGKADIEAVAVCGRAPRGTYKSQPSEPNAYGMDESVPHADVTIHDLGVITSIVMQNTPTGRELDPDVTSLQIWEDLPPDVGITNYARGGANVVTDDYGQVYVRRLIGSVPVASDGSAHYQVTGGLPLTLRLPDTATSLSKHLPRTLNEHFMSSPGESVHEAMRCDLFDGFCAGCHSSLSGKPLDSALKPDVLTRASDTQSYSQAPTHLDLPPNQRGNPTGP